MKLKALITGSLVVLGAAGLLFVRAQGAPKDPAPAWRVFAAPAAVTVREEVKEAPSGWTVASDDAPHVLAGITFYDGPPAEMGALKYDTEKKSGTRLILTWVLDPATPRGSWIRCRYAGTNAVLDQQLPKGVSAARVTSDTQVHVDGYEQVMSIELRYRPTA